MFMLGFSIALPVSGSHPKYTIDTMVPMCCLLDWHTYWKGYLYLKVLAVNTARWLNIGQSGTKKR